MKILFIVFYMLTAISSFSQNRKAEKLYDKAVKTYDKKNYVKALSLLNKSIDANPKDADSYNLRGCIFQDLNRYKESIEDFNTSIDLKEDNPDAYFNRANTYYDLGDYISAIRDYEKSIQLNPADQDSIEMKKDAENALIELINE